MVHPGARAGTPMGWAISRIAVWCLTEVDRARPGGEPSVNGPGPGFTPGPGGHSVNDRGPIGDPRLTLGTSMAILERHTAPSPAPTDEFVARGLVERLPMFGLGVVVCLSVGYGFGTLMQFDHDWRDAPPVLVASVEGSVAPGAPIDQAIEDLLADSTTPVHAVQCPAAVDDASARSSCAGPQRAPGWSPSSRPPHPASCACRSSRRPETTFRDRQAEQARTWRAAIGPSIAGAGGQLMP